MNIYFVRKENHKIKFKSDNRIELYPDTSWESSTHRPWDDFGFQTTFQMKLFYEDKVYDLPLIKILIENEKSTHNVFKNILKDKNSNHIEFPLQDLSYISLPTDTEFYDTLKSLFDKEVSETILKKLHEASYIQHTNNLQEMKFLMETTSEGFHSSLLRDMTSKKALEYGWLIIDNRTLAKEAKFELHFKLDGYENEHKININYGKSIFPNNINVLIGSNGTGKSQTIVYLINELLGIGESQQVNRIPVFNQIVAIAYSPFEDYRTSLKDTALTVKSSYQYFGFRDEDGNFNQKLPFKNSIKSLMKMLKDDDEKDYLLDRKNKFDSFIKVISKAVNFDYVGFEVSKVTEGFQPFNENKILDNKYYIIQDKSDFFDELHMYEDKIQLESGIVFFKDDKVLNLSSGQQIFSQLISSIIGSIRDDTILLIDEPELYLHPNLEVELIEMLKELLDMYNSYAVIATHSAIVVREVAQSYITVLKRIENKIHVSKPPFETFGGDIERINSYVFFDSSVKKPYEKWLEQLVLREGGVKKVIEKYGDQLNEESMILIYGMDT